MIIKDREFQEILSAEELQNTVRRLADSVMDDYRDKNPYFLVMMNGAFVFASDFLRNIGHPVKVGFVKYTSYVGMHSTGKVTPVLPIPQDVEGKDVVLLEDMTDTGCTMHFFLEELKKFRPKSIAIVSLFCKPESLQYDLKIDYVGVKLPNQFVAGYGLDYDGEGRNLPTLYYTKNDE